MSSIQRNRVCFVHGSMFLSTFSVLFSPNKINIFHNILPTFSSIDVYFSLVSFLHFDRCIRLIHMLGGMLSFVYAYPFCQSIWLAFNVSAIRSCWRCVLHADHLIFNNESKRKTLIISIKNQFLSFLAAAAFFSRYFSYHFCTFVHTCTK